MANFYLRWRNNWSNLQFVLIMISPHNEAKPQHALKKNCWMNHWQRKKKEEWRGNLESVMPSLKYCLVTNVSKIAVKPHLGRCLCTHICMHTYTFTHTYMHLHADNTVMVDVFKRLTFPQNIQVFFLLCKQISVPVKTHCHTAKSFYLLAICWLKIMKSQAPSEWACQEKWRL